MLFARHVYNVKANVKYNMNIKYNAKQNIIRYEYSGVDLVT